MIATENKVTKEQMETLPRIIAVDFDGTLVTDKYPEIGTIKYLFGRFIEAKKRMPDVRLILWTCRDGERLEEAVQFCKENGLEFDAVNKNIPEVIAMFGKDTRKIYANEYWDDKVPFENWLAIHGD